MIQAITETGLSTNISTEDNRIDTSVASTQIRFLVKFINDLDGSIAYAYPQLTNGIKPRFTEMAFVYNINPNMYSGQIKLFPAGHWKYEVYEVSWTGTVEVVFGKAPATETDILPASPSHAVVQGIVTKGILNLTERSGTEQVQYTQHAEPDETNYIYYGQ